MNKNQWEVKNVKARTFTGDKVTDALKALVEFFEPIEEDCTLLAITIECDIEEKEWVTMAIWEG